MVRTQKIEKKKCSKRQNFKQRTKLKILRESRTWDKDKNTECSSKHEFWTEPRTWAGKQTVGPTFERHGTPSLSFLPGLSLLPPVQ